jgi:lipid-A-disaccharide synthase
MNSVLIIAAEASSSLYAERLLEYWQTNGKEVSAFGIGSRAMEELGFECLGRSEEMAVVGVQEVVKHLPLIRRVFHGLLEHAEKRQPKFALLMDYPDFNLRLAKELRKRGIKVVYYISPQVWAWRSGRVHLISRVVDHMLVLFPFEEVFYREHGVKVDFVGHPLLDELPEEKTAAERLVRRQKFGIAEGDIVLGLMPGSRRSEISHHLDTQLATAALLVRENPRIRPILMVAPTLERSELEPRLSRFPFPMQIVKESPLEMIDLADVILVASGTATLMVGLMRKPMVIMYRMNPITAWLARKLVTKTKFFGMVNLIMDRMVVPELFQEDANPERLQLELRRFIDEPESYASTVQALTNLRDRLGKKGATKNVARLLDGYLK